MVGEKERIVELFEELVPASGKAGSVAGELTRAANRIGYRYANDGDMIGVDYGNETCNAPARYIRAHTNADIGKMIDGLWGWCGLDSSYEMLVDEMCQAVADYIDANPSLREQPTEDMWDHVADEDHDYGEEECAEEEYGYCL